MTALFLLALAGLLLGSSACVAAAREAAETFAFSVLPALFPLMVLCALWRDGGPSARHGAPARWLGRLFGLPPAALPALLLGLLGGSPTGARLCRALPLTPVQRKRLLAYTGTMSPLFFTGALALWLQSPAIGYRLLACHWLAALLCGELARLAFREVRPAADDASEAPANVRNEANVPPPGERLRDALAQAANALLVVCGAMMLCAVAFALVSAGIERLWPGFAGTRLAAALHAALEIGAGAAALAGAPLSPGWQAALCGLCGFGGASMLLQNLGFAQGCVRARELLALRLLQGALAAGLYALLAWFCGGAALGGAALGGETAAFGSALAQVASPAQRLAWLPVACLLMMRLFSSHKRP